MEMKTHTSTNIGLLNTNRQRKGYAFEKHRARDLNRAGIIFQSNQLDDIQEWKEDQGKGPDFIIQFLDKQIEIEAKHSLAKIFPSWILRDYLDRYTPYSDYKIHIHNEGMKLSEESKNLLDDHGIIRVKQNKLIQTLLWIFLLVFKKYERRLQRLIPQLLLLTPYLIFLSCVTRLLNLCMFSMYKFRIYRIYRSFEGMISKMIELVTFIFSHSKPRITNLSIYTCPIYVLKIRNGGIV